MTPPPTKPYVAQTGRSLIDADIEALADGVAGDIEIRSAWTVGTAPWRSCAREANTSPSLSPHAPANTRSLHR